VPKRSASVKNRLPFSYIKTSTTSPHRHSSRGSIKEPEVPRSPKLVDDNFYLYVNNSNLKKSLQSLGQKRHSETENNTQTIQRIRNNLNREKLNLSNNNSNNDNYDSGFTRSTFKTSSFHTYRRHNRYFIL
jgi:hypothetical protein